MVKQLLVFVTLLVLQGGVELSVAAPQSLGSEAFDEWLKTFDPSTEVASKITSCATKPNGLYADEPDTCSATYYACISGIAYQQTCSSGLVFDNTTTVRACVDRYIAASPACEKYPPATCTADNIGVYEPTARCSDWYYICLPNSAQPTFQTCRPLGLPTVYFNPMSRTCGFTFGVSACDPPVDPPTVLPYGCTGKTPGLAYAITTCSISYYTCESETATPAPGSCNALSGAGAGTVFDYRATPAVPSSSLCVPKSSVPECPSSTIELIVDSKSESSEFKKWLATFDPLTAVATKSVDCVGKPDGLYPNEPDTCSNSYFACFSGKQYPQNCLVPSQVFDADSKSCKDRYDATSSACSIYPPPSCDGTNEAVFQPTERCSEFYYICVGGQLYIQSCSADEYFDPATLVCKPKASGSACEPTTPPPDQGPTYPPYGCSGKRIGFAYATYSCSISYYTCTGANAQPTPRSCGTGLVFDYEKEPALVIFAPCIPRQTAPGCTGKSTAFYSLLH